MSKLNEIEGYLNDLLDVKNIPDYSGAHNGLQLQNDGSVTHVAAAVDASEQVIQKAVASGADLLIVHHGMFWQGVQKVTNAFYRKLKLAMDNNLAIYSCHIPLDIHSKHGNNAILSSLIGMDNPTPYGDYKGISLGLKQELDIDLDTLISKTEQAVQGKVHVCRGGSNKAGVVGVVTGGAGSEVESMKAQGIDTFITGEGPHWSYPLAEELSINVIYAGHYATETFGVRRLSELVKDKFNLNKNTFIDHPTGL